jgi:hypothetical protein
MTKTEETLRAATREHAGQVTPSSIAPLDLAGIPFDRPRFLRPRAGQIRLARPGLLVPVLAALAVVVLVAASLALPRVLSSHGQPATPALTVPAGVPPYYLALAGTGTPAVSHPQDVTVVDTRTGQRLATVTPPKGFGTFSYIIGGGAVDDRTWVVGASIWKAQRLAGMVYPTIQPVTFFLLTFDPRYQVIRLRQLPGFTVTAPPGTPGAGTPQQPSDVRDVALSPDGSRLAVAVSEGSAMKLVIHVTPLVPGAHGGTWVLPGSLATGGMRGPLLTWAADERTLSIATMQDFIFLDTARPSGELLAASRVVPFTGKTPAGTPYACFGSAVMSLDATTMTCAGTPSANLEGKIQSVGIVTISARTGVPLSYMPVQQPYHPWVTGDSLLLYWASPTSPDEYIAFPAFVANGHATPPRITVWRNGKLAETIPWPVGVNTTGTVGDFVW